MVGKKVLAAVALCVGLVTAPMAAQALTGFGLGVQAGYGSVEAELQVPGGYFLDVGIPWFVATVDPPPTGVRQSLPLGAKVGAQWELLGPLALRAGPRVMYAPRRGLGDVDLTRTYGFAEVGARLDLPLGLVVGADASLVGFEKVTGSSARFRGPSDALRYSQAYIGLFLSF